MKRDEDVWISRGTKASRPDELGPDQGSGVADRALQARQEMRKGENPALTLTSLGPGVLAVQLEMEACHLPTPTRPRYQQFPDLLPKSLVIGLDSKAGGPVNGSWEGELLHLSHSEAKRPDCPQEQVALASHVACPHSSCFLL